MMCHVKRHFPIPYAAAENLFRLEVWFSDMSVFDPTVNEEHYGKK
ncbi:MAG: hypothetical protein H6Q92_1374, partial [Nitrospirae bacterium]|nr:hypothetical protein [Nitrospirota bacterium]